MKTRTLKFQQQRKFYMMLPVLAFPFITMIFWALGGGHGSPALAMTTRDGLNTALPTAQFEKEREQDLWDKFTLYENAARDSAAYETARENDPYFDLIAFQDKQEKSPQAQDKSKLIGTFKSKDHLTQDIQEEKINAKLDQLYQEINKAASVPSQHSMPVDSFEAPKSELSEEVTRLENMMEMMQQEDEDPEIKQLEGMLEKLLDIQHPQRVRDRLETQAADKKSNSFSVTPKFDQEITALHNQNNPEHSPVATLQEYNQGVSVLMQNDFYGLQDEQAFSQETPHAIEAVIHDTQELVAGATVRMRLITEVVINNQPIPKDHFIYGTCAINAERLTIEINSIRKDNVLLPVKLSVYDLDGLEGIYMPGAISRDAAKQATSDVAQGIQLLSMDNSFGAQAASAGIEATKGLLSKKAKLIKVTVKAGYHILLKDTKQQ